MFYPAQRLKWDRFTREQLAGVMIAVDISFLDFDVGELPQMRVDHAFRTAANQEMIVLRKHKRNEAPVSCHGPRFDRRELIGQPLPRRKAELSDRAQAAPGLFWCADERSQLHQRLIEPAARMGA